MLAVIQTLEKLDGEMDAQISEINNLVEQRFAVFKMPEFSALVQMDSEWKPLLCAKLDILIGDSIQVFQLQLEELQQNSAKLRCFCTEKLDKSFSFEEDFIAFVDNLDSIHRGYEAAVQNLDPNVSSLGLKKASLFDTNPEIRSAVQRIKADIA
uniref:DHC_N2 domain-containing protein n=1 Tax=Steinernema glaseri TaxID=37863 RepID=A0A1I7Z1F3_9BILA